MMKRIVLNDVQFHPLTADRWSDLQRLFGEHGASGGCWCMFWRVTRSESDRLGSDGRQQAFKRIVKSGEITGILAYSGDEPIGWCSIAPRETFGALDRSRTLKRIDDQAVWSIVCFFVARPFRHSDLMAQLLAAAIDYAAAEGAKIVEGYPIDTKGLSRASVELYMGVASAFKAAGFVVVRREPRLIVRYFIDDRIPRQVNRS
jgi:GNAT superfamily N-acetyltransferase